MYSNVTSIFQPKVIEVKTRGDTVTRRATAMSFSRWKGFIGMIHNVKCKRQKYRTIEIPRL